MLSTNNQTKNLNNPLISDYLSNRKPSAIRAAQIVFSGRKEKINCIDTAIGNVSLTIHPSIGKRMFNLKTGKNQSLKYGKVMYSPTIGLAETNSTFLKIISSGGFKTDGLYSQITDGSSQAMEYIILGVCGEFSGKKRPILVFDPTYTNYLAMTDRTKHSLISVKRELKKDGSFSLPSSNEIKKCIKKYNPNAILVIPYDNPTGQFFDQNLMVMLAKLCVQYNLWFVSDEAYRFMYYGEKPMMSIWGITNKQVPGIEGRRVSLESASKVFNACGLRIGAVITDNKDLHEKILFEGTSNLCAPVIGQYIFAGLNELSNNELQSWYKKQRDYYKPIMQKLTSNFKKILPKIIISKPEAAIYSVIDVKNIAKKNFDAMDFVMFCAKTGKANINGTYYTLLISPMSGFYNIKKGEQNPGKTQMRIACVQSPEKMSLVPQLFKTLFEQYEKQSN